MWVTERAYQEGTRDFKAMCQLVIDLNKQSALVYDWSLGRIIDWKFGLWSEAKQKVNFAEDQVRLWYSYLDELVGFVVSEDGSNEVQFVVKNGYEYLYAEMIRSLLRKGFSDGKITTACNEEDIVKLGYLEKAGFTAVGECERTFVYHGADIELKNNLPVGSLIKGMNENLSIDKQTELKRNAFRDGMELSNSELFAYRFVKTSPIYDPEMDLVIIDQQGNYVAGCEGFLDYDSGIMEIERVCTHRDFRNRGLARQVINECIRRGIARGIKKIQITGWNEITWSLYSSFGKYQMIRRMRFERELTAI